MLETSLHGTERRKDYPSTLLGYVVDIYIVIIMEIPLIGFQCLESPIKQEGKY